MANRSKQRMQGRRAAAQRKNRFVAATIGIGVIGLGAVLFFSYAADKSRSVNFSPGKVAPEIGALAPDFALRDIDGNNVSLRDFRGKPVAVMLFHSW